MLCDAHIHFIPPELSEHTSFYKGVWSDKDALYRFLDQEGIDRAFLVYPSTDAGLKLGSGQEECRVYNESLAQLIKENPKIIAAGIVDLDSPQGFAAEVAELKQKGFGAVSLPSSHRGVFLADKLEPLLAAAEKNSLAVFVHPQTINPIGFERVKDPLLMPVLEYSFDISICLGLLMMEGVFARFKVNFIFAALGGVTPFLKDRFDRVYAMLRKRNMVKDLSQRPSQVLHQVYVDTSGSCLANIKMALDLFGEAHVLWGSDYPVAGDMTKNLEMLKGLSPELEAKITHENFLEVFGK